MKKHDYKVGDIIIVKGKQGIVEALHEGQIAIFMVEDQERYLVSAGSIKPCEDKYDKMEKATG